ncbi:nitronate monooxygenase [Acrasis kona]|uniref:Nitronate monooxygenase n=1 Tax=Acrasis kona TaxID=1008807 RepID=A0AAW2YID9_9EUKA
MSLTRLGLRYPLIVAPMAGGPSTPKLTAISSNTGALGSIGAAYLTPNQIKIAADEVKKNTQKPFAINLFVPSNTKDPTPNQIHIAKEELKPYEQQLHVKIPDIQGPFDHDFDQQVEAVLDARPSVFSFCFGLLPKEYIKKAHDEGILVVGTATTVDEAILLCKNNVDAIVLQGVEAGGHRGIFDAQAEDPQISTFNLLNDCLKNKMLCKVPLIAAGGIMNSNHIKKMLNAGASAVQMGTAFLTCTEAGTSAPYRRALSKESRDTELTRVFSGRIARGIKNKFLNEMKTKNILSFPAQNTLTRFLRNASVQNDSEDYLSLWSGTGEGTLWTGSAEDLIKDLFDNVPNKH